MSILLYEFQKSDLAKKVKLAVGPAQLMTSLNMNGFSISILELDEDIKTALTAPAAPFAWFIREFGEISAVESPKLIETMPFEASKDEKSEKALLAITEELIGLEKELNAIDEKVGDGDAGSTFAAGSNKLKEVHNQLPFANPSELLITIGRILARETGGSSGVLLSIMFTRAGNAYKEEAHLGKALDAGLQKMKEFGGASEGQRTMIDAFQPAFTALANGESLEEAAKKAREGADKTREITNTDFGRSSYLSEKSLKGIPDPGAEAVARVFEVLVNL